MEVEDQRDFPEQDYRPYVKDEKGKKRVVCPECQKKIMSKKDILAKKI